MLVSDAIELLKRFPQTSTVFVEYDGKITVHVTSFMSPVKHYNGYYLYNEPDFKLPWLLNNPHNPQTQS